MSSNWRLEAISNAALKRKRTSFVLRVGENKVGKKKDCLLKIPSLLCSREHCSIFLDDDKIFIDDTSRNGTYITFSGDIGTKQFLNSSTEQPLENNDIISFGFNTASVYDINDKNAFIYRLVRESIECIDLMLSDDEDEAPAKVNQERPAAAPVATTPPQSSSSQPPATQGKIISIEDKVIDIGSDSDSNYSGDECLKNIEEMDEQSSSLSSIGSSLEEDSTSNLSMDSDDDDEDDDDYDEGDESNFVVTKTLINCDTPTETISLDTDESDSDSHDNDASATTANVPNDSKSNDQGEVLESTATTSKEKDAETTNGEVVVTSTSEITSTAPEVASASTAMDQDQAKNDSENKPSEASDKSEKAKTGQSPKTKNAADEERNKLAERLDIVKRRVAENIPRKINMTKAQPLRKRRRTLTESEYQSHKIYKANKQLTTEGKQLRKEKLADVERRRKEAEAAALAAAATATDTSERTPFVPKVKNVSISRGEQLLTDLMALNPSNL